MTATTAAVASGALTAALLELTAQRLRPHCSDPESHHLWLSEHEAERSIATRLCIGCPVFNQCGQAATARQERFGVWAGVDMTRRPGGKAQT